MRFPRFREIFERTNCHTFVVFDFARFAVVTLLTDRYN